MGGSRFSEGRVVTVDQYGRALAENDRLSSPSRNSFVLEESEERMALLYEVDVDINKGALEGVVIYLTKAGLVQQGEYPMEVSK